MKNNNESPKLNEHKKSEVKFRIPKAFKRAIARICKCLRDFYVPPTKLNKLIQYEISSSAVQANSSHAWVHKCMGAQKKRKESACLAFELISYGVSLFSFVCGTSKRSESDYSFAFFTSHQGILGLPEFHQ